VTTYVPLLFERSNTHPREAKREKLERYVIEASKQCGRNVLMNIGEKTKWDSYASGGSEGGLRVLAHPGSTEPFAIRSLPAGVGRIAAGPEGGLTDAELAAALEHGWHPVNLGPRILRIETAALMLVSLMVTAGQG
jgi:16S rRNA (uracil1498-N3)-methyltransferase